MRSLKLVIFGIFFSLYANSSHAGLIMSGLDDMCNGCTLTSTGGSIYPSVNGTPLEGAQWVESSVAWGERISYNIFELDLNDSAVDYSITSLFVSFDDALIIMSGSNILFDSNNYSFSKPWLSVIDVIELTGELFISSGSNLSFYVNNVRGGPTGVIWKGNAVAETVAVSTPNLFGLCIAFIWYVGFLRQGRK